MGGTGLTRLTTGQDRDPAWSPDGTRIAFDRGDAVWIMNADGSDQHPLPGTILNGDYDGAAWSPDSRFIAHSCVIASLFHICVMPADGSELRTLTSHPSQVFYPAWSPDGHRIVFSQLLDPPEIRLFVINADETGLRQLTSGPSGYQDVRPRWSLSGDAILFYQYGPEGGNGVFWLRPDDPGTVFPTGLRALGMGELQPR